MKKLLALFMILCLALSFAACKDGKDDPQDTTGADATGTEAPSGSEAPTAPVETPTDPVETPTEPATAADTQPTGSTGPVITLSSTEDITVKAGETVKLPDYTCKDTDGRDLTSWVELEDNTEMDSVSGDSFTGHVAGDHTLYYSVETTDGRMGEAFLTVHVTPVHENKFDTQGADDCENMASYKTFRDGFEKGRKSPLYATIGDAGLATMLSADEDAIEGNSLIIDFAKSAGSSATAIYLNGFNDYFHRGEQATYKVTFDYKLIEAYGNTGDVYIGLSWDGSDGINRQFILAGAEVGETYTYTAEFPSAIVPEGGNAYFFIFKLRTSESPLVIAFDNFVIETIKVKQVKTVVPTAAELEKGFTWDFTTNTAICGGGQTVPVETLPADIKAAMAGNSAFSQNVLHLTDADDHKYAGLAEKNLTPGKVLTVDMTYYAVNDERFYLIMMGRSGNPTQTITRTDLGNGFVSVHLETNIQSGWYQLNIYGQNNPAFDIYIGSITVTVSDRGEADKNKTPNGYEVGMKFEQNERQFGLIDDSTLVLAAYDGYDFGEYADKMGSAPTKFAFKGTRDRVIEWFRADGKIETGCTYRITVTYFVDSFYGAGKLQYCFDRGAFPEIGTGDYMSDGFHEEIIEWVADRDLDYFCFYLDGSDDYKGALYMKGVTVELIALAS
ncbi:MAG: hypothetical protein MJ192_05930 [Clostridia bacterium]|nr:hypothetical protein [Clostridia bacterium]